MSSPLPGIEHRRTERLILRRPRPTDVEAVFAVHGDPRTNIFNPAGPDPDIEASSARLREWLLHWKRHGFGYWIAHLITGHQLVGFGGISDLRWRGRTAFNLYYRLAPSFWGKGLATEIAAAAVSAAEQIDPQRPVLARTRPGNHAAAATAGRVGLARRPDLDAEHMVFALRCDPEQASPDTC